MKATLLFLSVFLSASLFGQTQGTGVTDVDGNFYETVIIGNQEWMAENLKTSSYSNGESILNIPDSDTSNYYDFSYQTITSGAWTYYKVIIYMRTLMVNFIIGMQLKMPETFVLQDGIFQLLSK